MIAQDGHRVLIVSRRLLFAQGLVSLLQEAAEITEVEVCSNLPEALETARYSWPDTIVIDLPLGADFFVDRPISVDGREVKTIVLIEAMHNGQAHMYVHTPGRIANLANFMQAVLDKGSNIAGRELTTGTDKNKPPLVPEVPHTISLMRARASGPRSSRIPASKAEL